MSNKKKKNDERKKVGPAVPGTRFRVQFDFDIPKDEFRYSGKKMDAKSETVPDMNLTVRQLLQNHSRGTDSKVTMKEPFYFETEVPTIQDLTDVKRYKDMLEARLRETNSFIEQEKKEAAEKKKAEEAAKAKKDSPDPEQPKKQ